MLKIMNIHFNFLLQQGLSEEEFYGNLVYKFKKLLALIIFRRRFIKIISHYIKGDSNPNDKYNLSERAL